MKGRGLVISVGLLVLLSILVIGLGQAQEPEAATAPEAAVGTAFSYQGQVESGGSPVSGVCDFQFALYDAASGGSPVGTTQTAGNVTVTDGLFGVMLDFGGGAFTGQARWLEIAVRCPAGSGGFTLLAPRQALSPTPYALALPGLYTQQNAISANVIGGYDGNSVMAGVYGATIAGGGTVGAANRVTDIYGTVGGGYNNRAGNANSIVDDAFVATVGGGVNNAAGGYYSTIGGGANNVVSDTSTTVGGGWTNAASRVNATVAGGALNTASGEASTVAGGECNTASGKFATVSGGGHNFSISCNTASGDYAVIPGGTGNVAAGSYSLAAGRRASADHAGAFVWADATDAEIHSSAANQFIVRANGGVWIGQGTGPMAPAIGAGVLISTSTGAYLSSDGTWVDARRGMTPQQIAMLKWYTAVNTTQSNLATDLQPLGVAFDGENIWVVNRSSHSANVFRASDGARIRTHSAGSYPWNIAYDGVNMWITNDPGTVTVLRASDGSLVRTIPVGSAPYGLAFDGVNMWVANTGSDTVSVLRASDGAVLMTLPTGSHPESIAFDGEKMWVTNRGSNSVSVLRAADGTLVATYSVGSNPHGIAFDGVRMWVPSFDDDAVTVLRASDGALVGTYAVGSSPHGVAFDGTNMWITNYDDATVSVLRASDGALVDTIPVGASPVHIAFDGAYMWVTNLDSNTVSKR